MLYELSKMMEMGIHLHNDEIREAFKGCHLTSVHHSTTEQGGDVILNIQGAKGDVPLRIKPDGTVLNVVSAKVGYQDIWHQVTAGLLKLPLPTLEEVAEALNDAGVAAMFFHSGGGVMTVTVYDSKERMDDDQYSYRLMCGFDDRTWGADVYEFAADASDSAEHAWSETTEAEDLDGIVAWTKDVLARAQAHQATFDPQA